jgi:hypothetical protein
MKTNFTKENFLVLTNNENKIVAIIQCFPLLQDITEKLHQAISEDYDTDSIKIKNESFKIDENSEITEPETILNDFDYEFDFTAIIEADENEFEENFTLKFTAIY